MKFEAGKVYTHHHMLDVKMYILNVRGIYDPGDGSTSEKLSVLWVNRNGSILAEDAFIAPKNHGWIEVGKNE